MSNKELANAGSRLCVQIGLTWASLFIGPGHIPRYSELSGTYLVLKMFPSIQTRLSNG